MAPLGDALYDNWYFAWAGAIFFLALVVAAIVVRRPFKRGVKRTAVNA